MSHHHHVGVVLALAITAALAGCATGADAPSTSTAATAATSETNTAAAASVETEQVSPQAGTELVSETDVDAAKDIGFGVYTTSTGTKVAIDKHAPLPAEVVADIRAVAGGAGEAAADKAEMEARSDARSAARANASAAGKTLVFVVSAGQYGKDGSLERSYFAIATTDRGIVPVGTEFGTAADALATAQSSVAAQKDPTIYEIIDLTQ
jgi:uncharacterized protein (UPF0333 family)